MLLRFVLTFICLWGLSGFAEGQQHYRIVSYNVENLFDIQDDPDTRDEDFTPFGRLHWNQEKYTDKLLKLAEVVKAVGEGEFPVFIGLCEVENRRVLEDLTQKTGLTEGGYGIVHRDSPDARGIDVAFLYRKALFRVIDEEFLPIPFAPEEEVFTRDILYVSGILEQDTLHFMVCHFPSMSGGEAGSEWKRKRAAAVVKEKVGELQSKNPEAAIVIMGDLNGKADRPAQTVVLDTKDSGTEHIQSGHLYNTGYYLLNQGYGSYKYKGTWQTIDHIIVSGALLNGNHVLQTDPKLQVFNPRFLLEEDKTYYGFKPFRTYLGPRYHGGYSDHLPIYLDLKRK